MRLGRLTVRLSTFAIQSMKIPENFASLLCGSGSKEKRINRAALIDKQRNNAPAGLFCWAELENDFGPEGVVFIVMTTMELEL